MSEQCEFDRAAIIQAIEDIRNKEIPIPGSASDAIIDAIEKPGVTREDLVNTAAEALRNALGPDYQNQSGGTLGDATFSLSVQFTKQANIRLNQSEGCNTR